MGVRLNKFIAENTAHSRRNADQLIKDGLVTINGQVAKLGDRVNPVADHVKVKGKLIQLARKGLLILHKPVRYITSRSDPEGRKTVYDLLPQKFSDYISVGRLDYFTSGLLLFTNDGDFANKMTHPSYQIKRVYRVRVKGEVKTELIDQVREGVKLEDGEVKADLKILNTGNDSSDIEITLTEGRNRIVRRLMDFLGHPVVRLKRIAFGPIALGNLSAGKYELIPEEEFKNLRKAL